MAFNFIGPAVGLLFLASLAGIIFGVVRKNRRVFILSAIIGLAIVAVFMADYWLAHS